MDFILSNGANLPSPIIHGMTRLHEYLFVSTLYVFLLSSVN